MSDLGWTDSIDKLRQRWRTYTDQDGNDVLLCAVCWYWRATDGDLCETCAREALIEIMEEE